VLKNYYLAKVAADECLTALSSKRGAGFAGISLRPGNLTDEEDEGKVALGQTAAKGQVRRGDVARVAMALLENESVGSCWLDLLKGDETVESAISRCVKEHDDCSEGENIEAMRKEWT
jgi:nucleoside-diphosphate-sugar epimerase